MKDGHHIEESIFKLISELENLDSLLLLVDLLFFQDEVKEAFKLLTSMKEPSEHKEIAKIKVL